MHSNSRRASFGRALSSVLSVVGLGLLTSCTTMPGSGGVTVPFGSGTIRPIQAGDTSTYNFSRVFKNNSKFQGTVTVAISTYSSATFGQGLSQTRTITYDTFDPNGTKTGSATHTDVMSFVPDPSTGEIAKLVETSVDGTVTQVTTPAGGVVLPYFEGTLESGQTFSYSYTLSDSTTLTNSSTVGDAEAVTVPFGKVDTLKVSASELSQGPSGTSSTDRTVWRHPVLGVVKRVSEISNTPSTGSPNTSEETIELVSTNIPTGS